MLNKKVSINYILLIIITLLVALYFSAYACHDMYSNLYNYITIHNNINNK